MATVNSREARRKKILERGSDRLALITGKVDSISSSSTEPRHSHSVSLPATIYQDHHHHQQSNAASQNEYDVPPSELPRQETSNVSIRSASVDMTYRPELQLRTRVETTRTSALDKSKIVEHQPVIPSAAWAPSNSAVDGPSSRREAKTDLTKNFTSSNIRSSISASESIRIVSAITIALFVVLSQLRIPILSSDIVATIIATRPVYLVLLTDVTIVLVLILLKKQAVSKKMGEEPRISNSEVAYNWTEGVGTGLETGLLVYKAITAAFMDCSVYLVVVICGVSLLRGWF